MSDTLPMLRRQIKNTEDLRSVVKTMKAMSAANIAQFEQAVLSLEDYHLAVERALSVCARTMPPQDRVVAPGARRGIIVIGTDQGMAGQFNEHVVAETLVFLKDEPSETRIWAVGERAQARLENAGRTVTKLFPTPQSAPAIAHLVSDLLLEVERGHVADGIGIVDICHNVPVLRTNYETRQTQLLPLDRLWHDDLSRMRWPTRQTPQVIGCGEATWAALVSEFLFVSLYRAVAGSCAAENAARLAAMQRAESNIDERRHDLDLRYNHRRQSSIDEELFDLISGFEALTDLAPTGSSE